MIDVRRWVYINYLLFTIGSSKEFFKATPLKEKHT